nr:hypothetical protein [uncultured Draconibacterium sp.]
MKGSVDMVNDIKELKADITYTPKLILFPGVGHNCWTMTYNDSGMGKEHPDFEAFEMNIYDWLFRYKND